VEVEKITSALSPEEWRSALEIGLELWTHSHSERRQISIQEFQKNLELRWCRSPHWVAALSLQDQPPQESRV